jgi:hypothetical protein
LVPGDKQYYYSLIKGKTEVEKKPVSPAMFFDKMKYRYTIRAGSLPPTNDIVAYPKQLLPGDNGRLTRTVH